MVNPEAMAVINGVDNLKKDGGDEGVVTEVLGGFGNHGEEITVGTIGENDVDTGGGFDDVVEGNDIVVVGGEDMKGNLPTLERTLSRIETDLVQTLDGVVTAGTAAGRGGPQRGGRGHGVPVGGNVPSEVDDTVGTETEDGNEFEVTVVDAVTDEVLGVGRVGEGRIGHFR